VQLNEEQTLAVEHSIGEPACLIAGAGSGKTRVLTERVRWLMKQGITPRRICAITFTNKAAHELVNRLGFPPDVPKDQIPRVSTIHSLALGAIRRNPLGFGLQARVSPLDEGDAGAMVKKIIDRLDLDENQWNLLDIIGYHRARGLCFSSEYTEEVHKLAMKAHGGVHSMDAGRLAIWKGFEEEKKNNSVVDFDDMIHLVVHRGKNDPVWRGKLEKTFEFLLMDEAQDTNPIQWAFVNLLVAPDNPNLYVVGDMSQSIYGFNGATPELLKEYSEGWRGLKPHLYRIARNHRSVPEIVNMANATQGKMTNTIPLKMESWRGTQNEHGTTKLMKACEPRDIAVQIATEIYHDANLKKNPITYRENAVLVRSGKTQVRDIEAELVKRRIPYVVRGGLSLLQTEEVRDLMAYMRLIANPNDFMALVRASSIPKRGVGPKSLENIRDRAKVKYNDDLVAAASEDTKLGGFSAMIKSLEEHKNNPLKALTELIATLNYAQILKDKYRREPERVVQKLDNLDRLQMMVQILLEENEMTIEDLVFQLSIDKQSEESSKDDGKVVISTIHSAKGLEWKRVYVTNCYEGSLPHRLCLGSLNEIEEERRLFYVACTRARDNLILCVPAMQQMGPNTNSLSPSRFLHEIGIR
jgi:DNA helicase II / ATP-dependent DNA helicase PcrA